MIDITYVRYQFLIYGIFWLPSLFLIVYIVYDLQFKTYRNNDSEIYSFLLRNYF